jgi:DNA-binding transcriptional LysR family regulator
VLALARQILACEEHIRQEAAAKAGETEGRVRLGSLPSVSARLLPTLVGVLKRRHPRINVVLFEGSDDEVLDWLRSRAVDVAVVVPPIKGFETIPLASDQMLAVLPAAHPLSRATKVSVAALTREPFVMSKGGCEPMIRAIYRRAGKNPTVRYEVREATTILAMVREGLGITMMPELLLPPDYPGVRGVPLSPPARRRLALAFPSLAGAPPAVQTFVRESSHDGERSATGLDSQIRAR